MSIYANVLALLQQNCTLVNELLANRTDKIVSNIDLCKIKNITPAILTGLLVLTNFKGYTGLINYLPGLLNVRASKHTIYVRLFNCL